MPAEAGFSEPVSVIICARNEAKNLEQYLPTVLHQNYPNFEVVVVNDCSVDGTYDVLRVFQAKYPQLKVVTINEHPRFKTAKKFAVTLGIKGASNEILLFTDADCEPASQNWISHMVQHYQNPDTQIVLGYSPYKKFGGLLNALIRFETFQTAINYFAFALIGMPYMGVGRNLSYKKSLFFEGKGFASHMHIPSGDDDLFVNQNANSINTAIEISADSHVFTQPKTTWASYWKQKIRHLGASKLYKPQHKVNLTLQATSAIGFYVFFILGLILKVELVVVLAIFGFRFACQLFIYYKPLFKFGYKDLTWILLILDPFYYIYLGSVNIARLFIKKTTWK
ncbi:glycosyltransferase [Pelobium manganitolerans]|uniref:glycosyltransferase n=1 Tax=Pelobium manganitolerans TaxID=1842495 RepID=UPI003FA39CDB